ncbi:hypothetical protein E2C01_075980 [Portunus trituberculatus]|uniref:Uncharacterized protein n=1 Tax=Portunus trituberculatus TaxID=210409 RepID=A0A5B7IKU2_PORTR|nr:hypothetical protein [Portunus trituberculatus]
MRSLEWRHGEEGGIDCVSGEQATRWGAGGVPQGQEEGRRGAGEPRDQYVTRIDRGPNPPLIGRLTPILAAYWPAFCSAPPTVPRQPMAPPGQSEGTWSLTDQMSAQGLGAADWWFCGADKSGGSRPPARVRPYSCPHQFVPCRALPPVAVNPCLHATYRRKAGHARQGYLRKHRHDFLPSCALRRERRPSCASLDRHSEYPEGRPRTPYLLYT